MDLRSKLPAAVAAHAKLGPGEEHHVVVEVGSPPAEIQLDWTSFRDGPNAYLLSLSAKVVHPASGLELSTPWVGNPINDGTEAAVDEGVPVTITWTRRRLGSKSLGDQMFEVRASGTAKKT